MSQSASAPEQKIEDKKATFSESSNEKTALDKPPVVNEKEKKKEAFIVRTTWTFVMISVFIGLIVSGHKYTIGLVLLLQTLVFKEIIGITSSPAQDKNLPFNKSISWYFLAASAYYLDGETLIKNFKEIIFVNKYLLPLATHHKFISYCLYVCGFVFFVASLKKGYLKFQFAQLCITHMTLLLVVFQSHLIINNILTGMYWFVLPVSLVITNDIFAYICGITFGKTQLIAISPKKTVEGFVGAWICTAIMAVFLSHSLSQSNYLTCPAADLSTSIFSQMSCDPNPSFISQIYKLPYDITNLVGIEYIYVKPMYLHAMVLATFASLIAPFGGFFASGLKRAFKIKDFGDTIPGHGGITDRMDCQFLMGSFSYLYYQTFVSTHNVNIGSVLQMAVVNLTIPQTIQLVKSLHKYLYSSGAINEETYNQLSQLIESS